MPWTITESSAPQAPVKPPGEPVRWDAVPEGAWVWLIGTKQYACKTKNGVAVLAGDWLTASSVSSSIPCPPDWRFEARVVDGSLRFVPLADGERKEERWQNNDHLERFSKGELVEADDGSWFISDGEGFLICLIDNEPKGYRRQLYRRPRGPVALTYTPPGES